MSADAGSSGRPDLSDLLNQAQAMQQQLVQAQEELGRAEVTGSAGGGLVTATVTGTGEVVRLAIDPKACDPEDTETLADLVLAAIRDATNAARQLQINAMGPLAEAFGAQELSGTSSDQELPGATGDEALPGASGDQPQRPEAPGAGAS